MSARPRTRPLSRDGLIWDDTGLDLEPRWGREPDIEAITRICRRHLDIEPSRDDDEEACTVTFHAAGSFNRMYLVQTARPTRRGRSGREPERKKYMMRVSLPVDPVNKTRGEVSTLQLVRRKTDIPVPDVIAFDDSSDNEIGFEWILMEFIPGKPAYYRWRKMSMTKKAVLVARVADFMEQLSRCGNGFLTPTRVGPGGGGGGGGVGGGAGAGPAGDGFRGIGTLGATCPDHDKMDSHLDVSDDESGLPSPGQIVSTVFFSGQHYHYPIPRGPFRSSHDWLQAYLNIIIREHTTMLAETDDQDDREYAEAALRVARKLLRLLHKMLPSVVYPPERTVLWHDDVSLMNIMVDEHDNVSGIIDWECVSTMPVWVTAQMPEFLRGADRDHMPDRNRYTDVSEHSSEGSADGDDGDVENMEDSVDNEGKTELYWIHLMEYEQTQLRKIYNQRMRQLRPTWDLEVAEASFKVDFLGAVSRCGAGFYLRRIEQWVDAIDRREWLGLMEVLRVGIPRKDTGGVKGVPGTSK